MSDKDLNEVFKMASKLCAQFPSFGEALDNIREKRKLSQKQLSKCIYRSEAEVSRLINNVIPRKLTYDHVYEIATFLNCTEQELGALSHSYACYFLFEFGIIDLDDIG